MNLTSFPPSAILTGSYGVLVGVTGGDTQLLSASGASDGDVLTVQADGSLAFETPAGGGAESVTDLTEWSLGTLTIPGDLIVQLNGGTAGVDELSISHDGTNGLITPASGDLIANGIRLGADGVQLPGDAYLMLSYSGQDASSSLPLLVYNEGTSSNGRLIVSRMSSGAFTHDNRYVDFHPKAGNILSHTTGKIGWKNSAATKLSGNPDTYVEMTQANIVGSSGGFGLKELSADPSNPAEGLSVIWQSNGVGSGDDGDIMLKITAGGVTKTITLVDFSAA